MAVQMFKDGESVMIDPSGIPGHLALGFSFEDPNAPPPAGLSYLNEDKPVPDLKPLLRTPRVHKSRGHQ